MNWVAATLLRACYAPTQHRTAPTGRGSEEDEEDERVSPPVDSSCGAGPGGLPPCAREPIALRAVRTAAAPRANKSMQKRNSPAIGAGAGAGAGVNDAKHLPAINRRTQATQILSSSIPTIESIYTDEPKVDLIEE